MSEDKKHIFLPGSAETTPFTSIGTRGRTPKYPQGPLSHGVYVRQRLENAWDKPGKSNLFVQRGCPTDKELTSNSKALPVST
jgi:hypothetical protein